MEISIAEFGQKYLPAIEEEFRQETTDYITEKRECIGRQLWKQLSTVVHFTNEFQKRVPIPIGEIQIALLQTSVFLGRPQIGIAAYDESGVRGNEIFQIKFDVQWLFAKWEKFEQKILKQVEILHAENHIHKEAIRQMMYKSMTFLIQSMSLFAKYPLREFHTIDGYEQMMLADQFRLTIGGYRDWSRILYVKKPEVDIFFHDSQESLRYCQFQSAVYNRKEFCNLDLKYTRFNECEFVHCQFTNVQLQDVVFEHCRMYHCTFENVDFSGATFIVTTMKKNTFNKVMWKDESEFSPEENVDDFYKDVEFIECEVDDKTILKEGV